MNIAYIDSNILVSCFLPQRGHEFERRVQVAHQVMDRFKTGTRLGVISNLALLEFAGICQAVAVHDTERMLPMSEDEREGYALAEGTSTYKKMASRILQLGHIKLAKTMNLRFNDMVAASAQMMAETRGTVSAVGKYGHSGFKFEFKRAYTADLLHVAIAVHEKCDEFYTFDRNIKKIEGHPLIESRERSLAITVFNA